jgi:hypothetical protein
MLEMANTARQRLNLIPDVGIHAVSDGGGSSPRAIVEIEVAHQSTQGSREQAG